MIRFALTATVALSFSSLPAQAEWSFSGGSSPNAFNQGNNMTLELQCDRIRFSPAGYEDSQDIVSKQGLSIRFMRDGATEAGAFQVGSSNAQISLVDDYPVELLFFESSDYDFVLDQLARNASVDLSMIDRDVTYGIFDLKGSGAAIKSLRAVCSGSGQQATTPIEAPEGVVYCGGGAVQRVIGICHCGAVGRPVGCHRDHQWRYRSCDDVVQLLRKLPTASGLPSRAPGRRPVRVPCLQRWGAELDRVRRLHLQPVQLNRMNKMRVMTCATI